MQHLACRKLKTPAQTERERERERERVERSHLRYNTAERGFHRGLVTAEREPLTFTVLRALHAAVLRSFGTIPSARIFGAAPALHNALEDAASQDRRRKGPSPAALLEIARCLATDAPLLLIIDEFGKNLEALSENATLNSAHNTPNETSTDPYLLQQLAEAGQGAGLPIFLLTLQHQSFDDYLSKITGTQSREWAKVQGRFEDVAYVESPAQTRALISSVFAVTDNKLQGRIKRWAKPLAQTMQSLGTGDLGSASAIASCWPLHPLTAVVLSELCQRYGQHERTLFSFLAGVEMTGPNGYLTTTQLPSRGALPTLGLDALYDYFVGTAGLSSLTAANSRWIEITTRLRDAHGLSQTQNKLAKAVAVLNLISTSGPIRASKQVLNLVQKDAADVLTELCETGLITHRGFADEYRIWQGTDIDIKRLIEDARQQIAQKPLAEMLSNINEPQPIVAARHSAQHDCLRVFSSRYATSNDKAEAPDAFSPYDGEVLWLVEGNQTPLLVGSPADGAKPVVVAIPNPQRLEHLQTQAQELGALVNILDNPQLNLDWVARQELSERIALAKNHLEQTNFAAFRHESCRWLLLCDEEPVPLHATNASSAISQAADRAYHQSPIVPNEMLNRNSLTTQGSKARRQLIEAMLTSGHEANLDLTGYGPEVAMYKALLAHTQIHRHAASKQKPRLNQQMIFGAPSGAKASTAQSLVPAWNLLEVELQRARTRRVSLSDITAALRSPPIGMKDGVIPVLVIAALLAHPTEIALYEHGTFKPSFTVDMAERLVRNPGFFEIKHFSAATGPRRKVVAALLKHLGVQAPMKTQPGASGRGGDVLSVAKHLVSKVRGLDNYTQRTKELAPAFLAVRDVLLNAVEPDELLFSDLPSALGFKEVPASDRASYPDAEPLAAGVAAAISELENVSTRLMAQAQAVLLSCSGANSRQAAISRAAAIDADALSADTRPFVLALANDGTNADFEWMLTIATVVSKKSPYEWNDDDKRRFFRELPERMAAFERLVALYGQAGYGQAGSQSCLQNGTHNSLRITFTQSDGQEHARLVAVEPSKSAELSDALQQFLSQAEGLVGSVQQAQLTAMAMLGQQVLAQDTSKHIHPVGADG